MGALPLDRRFYPSTPNNFFKLTAPSYLTPKLQRTAMFNCNRPTPKQMLRLPYSKIADNYFCTRIKPCPDDCFLCHNNLIDRPYITPKTVASNLSSARPLPLFA